MGFDYFDRYIYTVVFALDGQWSFSTFSTKKSVFS